MKEIELKKELPVIQFNFEEVKKSLEETVKRYKNIIVTEETLKDCKADKRELASLRTKLDTYRKDVKREMEFPIKQFENRCKELIALIKDAETPINDGIKAFDDKKREEKRQKALEIIKQSIEVHKLKEEYASQLTVLDKYLNLTGSLKAIKDDVEVRATALEIQQKEEEQRKEMMRVSIQSAIDTANTRIKTKLEYSDFTKYIEFGWGLDRILKEVNEKAEMIWKAEQPKPEPPKVEEPVATEQPNNSTVKEPVQVDSQPKKEEPIVYIKFTVEHKYSKIQELSQYLKANGFEYEVHEKGVR